MPQSQTLTGFVTIGPGIYISLARISAAPLQPDDSAPNVILIFGWMGALTRHVQNYSRRYTELYPRATQIIVECEASFFWTSEQGRQNRLLPVVGALDALGCLPTIHASILVRPRVLVHSFSNGGALQVVSLSRLLSAKYSSMPPSEHLTSGLILDSSPAIGNFRSIGVAFSIAIRNPVVRCIALPLIYLVHAFRLALQTIFGMETMKTRYLRALLDPRLLPWMNSQTPRLYVFSKSDELVPWREVQQHADAATVSGLNVRCDVYEDSAHVSHMRRDPKRYWTTIQDLWRTACDESQVKDTDDAVRGSLRR